MLLNFVIRALFVIIVLAVLFTALTNPGGDQMIPQHKLAALAVGAVIALAVLLLDLLTPKKAISTLAAIFFGLLVGMFITWVLGSVVDLINEIYRLDMGESALYTTKWIMGICICFLVISFVLRTKDDVRFVIPYVEFSRQSKGIRPLVLDTSVIIDGRIADLCQIRLFDAPLIVPRFVLNELQLVSDSADKLKRNRGRRGLDMLNKLRTDPNLDVRIDDTPPPGIEETAAVDQKLVAFTKNCDGRLVTNDYNLNKIAQLREVEVININDIANCLKPVVLPGEPMQLKIIKPGEEQTQGIGYLDDGTMVVVENARNKINETITINVTSSLQTSAGRMIFGQYDPEHDSGRGSHQKRQYANSSRGAYKKDREDSSGQ